MRSCRRCGSDALANIRESIVRRGPRTFLVSWYRCTACQDVSFGYRLFPPAVEGVHERAQPDFSADPAPLDASPSPDRPLNV